MRMHVAFLFIRVLVVTSAPAAWRPSPARISGTPLLQKRLPLVRHHHDHSSSLAQGSDEREDCWDQSGLTTCSFDATLGTGVCPSVALQKIREALAEKKEPVTSTVRSLSPLPVFSALEHSEASTWPTLAGRGSDVQELHPGKLYVVDNFLTAQQAAALRNYHDDAQMQSSISPGPTNHCEFRKSRFYSVELKTKMPDVVSKIAHLTMSDPHNFESPQLTSYKPGDFYSDHYDTEPCSTQVEKPINSPGLEEAEACHDGSRRAVTVLIYLNDGMEGGATYFPRLGKRVLPKEGRAIIFHPTSKDGRTDPHMMHGSEETTSGQKFVVQQWITHG